MASKDSLPATDGLLTEGRLRAALGDRPFKLLIETASTNDIARAWAEDGAAAGSVVVAEMQHQGRGRFGREWHAPAVTSLLTSLVLRPALAPAQLTRVTMLAAVSIAEVIEPLVPHPSLVRLKWPNDVRLVGKKVAGVLSEASWRGDRADYVIVGIGLNVRVNFEKTPLAATAISLESVTHQVADRAALLTSLVVRLDGGATRLGAEGGTALWKAWRSRLDTLGKQVTVQAADRQIVGLAADVDEDGALLIREPNGVTTRVVAGEVTLQT
jgi:BirA family biotin operon repressor/biotin-[acetyl-CoA-carboxylase] ligase